MTTIKNQTIDVLRHGPHTELILKDGTFFTPARIYEMGMMACNLCGTIMPIEKKYCPRCQEWVICIHEDYVNDKNHLETIHGRTVKTPQPFFTEKRQAFISRFMANIDMQFKYRMGWDRYKKANEIFQAKI